MTSSPTSNTPLASAALIVALLSCWWALRRSQSHAIATQAPREAPVLSLPRIPTKAMCPKHYLRDGSVCLPIADEAASTP